MSLIGIDIGGTNIRVAAVSEEGYILRRLSVPTAPERGADRVIHDARDDIDRSDPYTDRKRLSARLRGRLITSTDPEVQEIVRQTADWVGLGLVNLCAIFAPDTIAIGGGVGTHLELMRAVIEQRLRQHRAMIPVDVPILAAHHSDDAGVIGAALQARAA